MKKTLKRFFKKSSKNAVQARNYKLLASSSLFDQSWYLKAYPDVAAAGMDPIVHYLNHGFEEGREPGPRFDSVYYLSQITRLPENQQMVGNPLLHFLQVGKSAGLKPYPEHRAFSHREVSGFQKQLLKFSPFYQRLLRLAEKSTGKPLVLPILEPIKKLKMTALVITWDVGHNPLGRSYMLAEALEQAVDNVVVCGFQFSRYGNDIWQPLRHSRLPVIALPGGEMSEWLAACEQAVKKFKPDVVIACKPRMPSVELGILFKEKYGIPLIVDVDDHELAFFRHAQPYSLAEVLSMPDAVLQKETEPFGEIWSRLTDSLTRDCADALITSNVALEGEFGGTVIPHVRDENAFDPALFSKVRQREKYSIPVDAKVVMFFGTPRVHKGVGEIAEAVGKLNDANILLVVVGEAPDKSVTAQVSQLAYGKVLYLPNQPFSAIPEIIVMADLVILPQDVNHPISKFQLPAKAIDAIGMGIPLLVSATEPMLQLVKDGVARLLPDEPLDKVIAQALKKTLSHSDSLALRKQFLLNYSYHSAALKLKALIETTLSTPLKPLTGFDDLKRLQHRLFPIVRANEATGIDIVVFWKQNDTGLYGRRSDMVIEYLASRDDVRKVVIFDAPISEFDIARLRSADELTQSRNIYIKIYEKLLGKLDTPKISYNVFAHPAGVYTMREDGDGQRISLFDGYAQYLQDVFDREGVSADKSVFWLYPKIPLAEKILDVFKPQKVVVDVVDDHRAWPHVSQVEKAWLTEHYQNLLGHADLAMANCQPVIDSMQVFNPDIRLVANGCEASPKMVEPINNPLYEELKGFKGKVIGFVGNLEAKIDIPLIERIADEFSDALIVLVGSTHANPMVRALQKHSNIRMFGVVPYENINAIVSQFDVGIVPHLKMDMTDNMNPLKVFVYLANRVPVVATEVKNLPDASAVITVKSHDEFIMQIHSALDANQSHDFAFLEQFTWHSRLKTEVDGLLSDSKQKTTFTATAGIPKKIHFVWFSPSGHDGLDDLPLDIRNNIGQWAEMFPDFEIKVWSKRLIEQVFSDSLRVIDAIETSRFEAMKSDIARVAIINREGGVYSDLKNVPKMAFLNELIDVGGTTILDNGADA
ncbi:hypothetical protein THMIRHAS_15160 [Thiosulfatimonas sediminis]|uniref:Glycosyl transferase family 1 domain-containing protein n=1 Tax=Thiosulfatimonas sediminis TaxID=2675054 RepID=A0A6F8PVH9_9GAMM|nr:glycosyltransferase [Thiosulfatimonas sediminis]BBP46143.1 hypothetical protein THMIRHAS_15160 [Thiosulfatimonas sediminis]